MKCLMRVVMLLLLFAWVVPALAQEDKNTEINKIKRSRDYLTVTGTSMVSAEEASENARMLIDVEIEQWLQENAEGDIAGYIAKSKENLAVIETKRGSLFRAFIYVKKKDILPYYENETVMAELPEPLVPETPVNVDTIKAEEIIIPPVEENVVKVESEEGLVSTVEYLPPVEKPVEEVIVAPLESASGGISNMDEEQSMLKKYSVSSVSKYLGQLKKADKLAEYGKEVAWPSTGVVYFFFADYNNVVRGYLKVSDGTVINLANGDQVEIADYLTKYETGTYIWFTLK